MIARSIINRFQNIEEFKNLVESQDDYRLLPITTEYAGRDIHSARVFGMTNITRNRVTMACGPKYPVFGHREALGYVATDIERQGVGIHGGITTLGDITWTHILFDGITAKDDEGKNVEMGVEFVNPMDKKTKFKGHAYTWRQTCSNGAGHKRLFPGLEINESHTVNMSIVVPPIIHDFIDQSLKQTDHMQKMIDGSMKEKVSFNSRAQVVATLSGIFGGITDRHIRGIAANVESLDPTRWDLFNATNGYTSHHAISPVVRELIDERAETFIDMTQRIVPAFVKPAAVD